MMYFSFQATANMNDALNHIMQHDSFAEAKETLLFLLEECSLDESPSLNEVAHWQTIFTQRGGSFLKLAERCQQFIQENQ